MTQLGKWLNSREEHKALMDDLLYGHGTMISSVRHTFNPMRYLLGDVKYKHIPYRTLFAEIQEEV